MNGSKLRIRSPQAAAFVIGLALCFFACAHGKEETKTLRLTAHVSKSSKISLVLENPTDRDLWVAHLPTSWTIQWQPSATAEPVERVHGIISGAPQGPIGRKLSAHGTIADVQDLLDYFYDEQNVLRAGHYRITFRVQVYVAATESSKTFGVDSNPVTVVVPVTDESHRLHPDPPTPEE